MYHSMLRTPLDHVNRHKKYGIEDSYRDFIGCNYDLNDVRAIERITRGQSSNQNWHDFRKGAVTASRAKQVCRLSNNYTSINNLLNDILCPPNIQTNAIQWGNDHEHVAIDWYADDMCDQHHGFSFRQTGLYMSTENPLIGASPDGLCYCRCCRHPWRKYLVEVKSPYNGRFMDPKDAAWQTGAFFQGENGNFCLKPEHKWNYQIQLQLGVVDVECCDLVISTKQGNFIVNVYHDEAFYGRMMSKLNDFIDTYLYPKLYDLSGFRAWHAQPGYLKQSRWNQRGPVYLY